MPDFAAFNCTLFSVSLLVSVCMLGTSFSVITPLQMAIKYDRNIHKLYEDKVIGGTRGDSGRFFTGLKVDFLNQVRGGPAAAASQGHPRAASEQRLVHRVLVRKKHFFTS